MPDWSNWESNVNSNSVPLSQYFNFRENPSSEKNNWDFKFRRNFESQFSWQYFIQVHRSPDCIYLYFAADEKRQTMDERIALRDLIVSNVNQLIEEKTWSFNLIGEGAKLGKGYIKYRIENNLTPFGDYKGMIDTMILIANNLSAIENGTSGLQNTKEGKMIICPKKDTQKEISQTKEEPQISLTNQQTNAPLFPGGVSPDKFKEFCKTKIEVPEYDVNGKKTGNNLPMTVPEFASWAVWNEPNSTNITDSSNLSIGRLFTDNRDNTLKMLQPNIVFVGENISRALGGDWSNFHDVRPQSKDYILRYAVNHSCFHGAYITDFIKAVCNANGDKVKKAFCNKENREELTEQAKIFAKEMNAILDLSNRIELLIILLGRAVQEFFKKPEVEKELSGGIKNHRIIIAQAPHYSSRSVESSNNTKFSKRDRLFYYAAYYKVLKGKIDSAMKKPDSRQMLQIPSPTTVALRNIFPQVVVRQREGYDGPLEKLYEEIIRNQW